MRSIPSGRWSLVADEWRKGRVLLAGDAAPLMPPFMGQGMCAGLRDVWNLSWKPDRVLRGTADDSLPETCTLERRPHVTEVIRQSMFLGSIICIPDPAAAAGRDAMFPGGEAPPPAPFPHLTGGMLARDAHGVPLAPAGELAPHGIARHQRHTTRMDQVVPPGFTLLVDRSIDPAGFAPATRAAMDAVGVRVVTVADRTSATDAEFADTQGQILPFMAQHGLLVRPDFHLFGAAADMAALDRLVTDLHTQAAAQPMTRAA